MEMTDITETEKEAVEAYLALDDDVMESLSEPEFLARQRGLLAVEREHYIAQASQLKAEADSLSQGNEPVEVQFDEESGEGNTLTVERERDLALAASAIAAVEEVEAAIAKIDQGTYGICESCKESIPRARLRALPYARLCVKCKEGGLPRRR